MKTTMMRNRLIAGTVFLFASTTSVLAAAASPFGVWVLNDGRVTVRVHECGSALCGHIAALKEPISKIDGKPKVDRENPKPALRKRPLIGLAVLTGMKSRGAATWIGEIYNPDDGKTYSASMTLDGRNNMMVKACIVGVFCKTNKFVRLN
jgi:uncharacterized protein (DUF2147 family)